MAIEIQDILIFVGAHEPFDLLPDEELDALCRQIEVSYYRAKSEVLHYGEAIDALYLIRSGSVEVFRRSGELFNRLEAGQVFGQLGILMNGTVRYPARALEDSLIYRVPAEVFLNLCDQYAEFGDYFEVNEHSTLKQVVLNQADENDMTTVRVCDIVQREPVYVEAGVSIHRCAKLMTEQRVSSVIIFESSSNEASELPSSGEIPAGIVTDRDLRSPWPGRAASDVRNPHKGPNICAARHKDRAGG